MIRKFCDKCGIEEERLTVGDSVAGKYPTHVQRIALSVDGAAGKEIMHRDLCNPCRDSVVEFMERIVEDEIEV